MTLDLARLMPSPAALGALPARIARAIPAIPVDERDGRLVICVADATDYAVEERLRRALGERPFELAEANDPLSLRPLARRLYRDDKPQPGTSASEANFSWLIRLALAYNASDIHLDCIPHAAEVRMRIDGALRTMAGFTTEEAAELTMFVKVRSNLDIAEKRAPQDGSVDMVLDGEEVNLRVATVPTIYGEHVTLRLLSQTRASRKLESLDALGLGEEQRRLFEKCLDSPSGIVVLSGPTGSGKTTTLYAALRRLAAGGERHLISIEDPVEKPVAGVTQIKVDARQDRVGFDRALRSVLRHDPDVVMIGEIRDGETAETAMRSALTGHLVLTTLHTNSAAGVRSRLIDLGVADYLVDASLRLSVAQRLVRRPCPDCRAWRAATEAERKFFGWEGETRVPVSVGCAYCGGSGYVGRTALYEMLVKGERVARSAALTLKGDAAVKIAAGETTVEEAMSVIDDL